MTAYKVPCVSISIVLFSVCWVLFLAQWPPGIDNTVLFLVTLSHELIYIPYNVVPWTWQQHCVLLNVWKYDCYYYVVSCVLNTTRESLSFEIGSER